LPRGVWARIGGERNPGDLPGFCCVCGQIIRSGLFGGASGFDAGACGGKKCSCGADYGEDCGWILRGVIASALCVQRKGDGEKESEAEECEGRFLHGWSPLGR
jgi:hypothetical protein